MEHDKSTCTSRQHSIHSTKDKARLVITYDLQFSEKALAEAPPHMRHAMDILREMIGDAKEMEALLLEDGANLVDGDGITIKAVHVDVCS